MFSQMSQDDTVRDMVRIESWKKCRLNTIFFIWNFYWAKIVLVLQKKVCLASHNNHPTSLASSWDISFLKSLVQQDPKGSNKVAHHFILDVYDSPNRKYVNLSIIYYIADFSFFMSQDDAYFHIHQNDPNNSVAQLHRKRSRSLLMHHCRKIIMSFLGCCFTLIPTSGQ